MGKSSIHIQKAVQGSVGHNLRINFSYSVVYTDEENEYSNTNDEAYSIYRSELATRSEAYTERTGQKMQKSTVTHLSAIVNLEQHHTLKDLEPLREELEARFDTKVFNIAIHRDEGKLISKEDGTELYSGKDFFMNTDNKQLYFDKKFTKPINMDDYEVSKNYHAHIEMLGLDSQGHAIRQKMNKVTLQQLQTFTANTLQMERGGKSKSYTKEQMKEIIDKVGKKSDYKSTTLYAKRFNEVAKELGYFIENRTKRKDTHAFKEAGAERENAIREQLAKKKDLKAEMKELRAELQEAGATREDYAELEQSKRELEAQIKDKTLTIEDMRAELSKYRSYKAPEKPELVKAQEIKTGIFGDKIKVVPAENYDDLLDYSSALLKENRALQAEREQGLAEENSKLKKIIEAKDKQLDTKQQLIDKLEKLVEVQKAKIKELEGKLKERSNMHDRQNTRKELNETKKSTAEILKEAESLRDKLKDSNTFGRTADEVRELQKRGLEEMQEQKSKRGRYTK